MRGYRSDRQWPILEAVEPWKQGTLMAELPAKRAATPAPSDVIWLSSSLIRTTSFSQLVFKSYLLHQCQTRCSTCNYHSHSFSPNWLKRRRG